MTSIQNLPEETLQLILNELQKDDLHQCQKVCRSLYTPAHAMLLRDISFKKTISIIRFMKAIDSNPHPSYLRAVSTLSFEKMDKERPILVRYRLNKRNIKKLFCRFPNLKHVRIYDALSLFNQFDDEICKEILKCCPKLEIFENVGNTSNTLYNLRLLLTTINMRTIKDVTPQPTQYITNFPHLKHLEWPEDYLKNFEDWLQILQKLPSLKLPKGINDYSGDRDNFADEYLSTLTAEEQTNLKMRLLEVDFLNLSGFYFPIKNAANFVNKYLTNVAELFMTVDVDIRWDKTKLQEYCHEALDYIAPAKSRGYASLIFLEDNISTMEKCFPFIADRVFSSPSCGNRILSIQTAHETGCEMAFGIDVSVTTSGTELRAVIHQEMFIAEIAHSLFGKGLRTKKIIPRHDIDEFILCIDFFYDLYISVNSYLLLLQGMPSVKKVTLDVPNNFEKGPRDDDESDDEYGDYYYGSDTDDLESILDVSEDESLDYIIGDTVNPEVEELTIRADNEEPRLENLLSALNNAFPHLKKLNLCYTCGIWYPHAKRFEVSLPESALEVLTIDVTPVKTRMYKMVKIEVEKKKTKKSMYYDKKWELEDKIWDDMDYLERKQAMKEIKWVDKKLAMLEKKDEVELKTAQEKMLKDDCFLVEVKNYQDDLRRLYKVKANLSSVTKLDEADLQQYEDHIRLQVNIDALKSLRLCAFYCLGSDRWGLGDYFSSSEHGRIKYITLY